MSNQIFEDYDDEGDAFDNLRDSELDNCGQFVSNGFILCTMVGSEDCEFCPCRDELGSRFDFSDPDIND